MNNSTDAVCGFLLLQSDWKRGLQNVGDQVWVGLKYYGGSCKTSYDKLSITEINKNLRRFNQSENFVVDNFQKYYIVLTSPFHNISTRFVAPVSEFSNIHKKSITTMDISSGGGLGVSSSTDGSLCIWDTGNGNVLRRLDGHVGDVNCCKFYPSGMVVLSGGMDTQLKIWSAEDGKCAQTLKGSHKSGVFDIDFVERGRNVVSCSTDGSVRLWECGSGSSIATIVTEQSEINSCHITKVSNELFQVNSDLNKNELEIDTKDKILVIACENGSLDCYGLQNRQLCLSFKYSNALNTCCFINETTLIAGSQDGSLLVADLRWPENFLVSFKPCESPVLCVHGSNALSHPCFWASCGNGRCSLYQVIITPHLNKTASTKGQVKATLRLLCELTGPDCDPVYQICESLDGFVYTSCRDAIVRKYKLAHVA